MKADIALQLCSAKEALHHTWEREREFRPMAYPPLSDITRVPV